MEELVCRTKSDKNYQEYPKTELTQWVLIDLMSRWEESFES